VERNLELINPGGFARGFFDVSPPVDADPGSMRREDIEGLIASYARTRNIVLATG
jgi:hypothetical protein